MTTLISPLTSRVVNSDPMKPGIFAGLLLSCALAQSARAGDPFNHPGILNSKEQLAFVKARVAAGQQPWKDALDKMKQEMALLKQSIGY